MQVKVLSFTDRNIKAAEELSQELRSGGFRVETDMKEVPIQGKIREAELQKIPYIIVLGDKEKKSKTLAVRPRGGKPKFGVKKEKFISDLRKEADKPYKNL